MSKHRTRHENAFRAGARQGIQDFLDDLLERTPQVGHAALKAIAAEVADRPEYRRLERGGA